MTAEKKLRLAIYMTGISLGILLSVAIIAISYRDVPRWLIPTLSCIAAPLLLIPMSWELFGKLKKDKKDTF